MVLLKERRTREQPRKSQPASDAMKMLLDVFNGQGDAIVRNCGRNSIKKPECRATPI